jgi:hypothetical protein
MDVELGLELDPQSVVAPGDFRDGPAGVGVDLGRVDDLDPGDGIGVDFATLVDANTLPHPPFHVVADVREGDLGQLGRRVLG